MLKRRLLTPGPTMVPPSVTQAMATPIIHHRTPAFGKLLTEITEGVKEVFQTKNDLLVFAASGTGGMEACVVNLLSPEDKPLVINAGAFGRRWVNIIKKFSLEPVVVEYPWGKAAKMKDIEDILKSHPEVKVLLTQSTETSTGVAMDIKSIAKFCRKRNILLVVDAISGLGGQETKTDDWGVDVVVAGSQKGFMCPPGLAFVSLSQKAWEIMENSKLPKFYWDFKSYKTSLVERKQSPYTPAVSLLFGLKESLRLIKEEGLENVFKRHRLLAEAARAGVKALGLELFAEVPCDVVTAAKVPEGVDGSALVKKLRDEYGPQIAGGQREYKGKIFRIAHMGYCDRFDIIMALSGLEMVLRELGYKIELGKAVAAAEKIFLMKTSFFK